MTFKEMPGPAFCFHQEGQFLIFSKIMYNFCMVKYLSFPKFFFCLKILFNVNGEAIV